MTSFLDPASSNSSCVQLTDGVRLRREHFGGLAYDARTGNTIELDRSAFRLLELARAPISVADAWEVIVAEKLDRSGAKAKIAPTVSNLIDLGILQKTEGAGHEPVANRSDGELWPRGPLLSAPEAVHWAITYRCPSNCPDCYAARHRSSESDEISETDAFRLVDRVADWGAFQLAIGGGEPLVRTDLPRVVRHARERGLSVHVTTSGIGAGGVPDVLLEAVTCLQIGIRYDELLGATPPQQLPLLQELCRRSEEASPGIGANLMLCRTVIEHLDVAIERLADLGCRRITLLRYKAPGSLDRWLDESPDPWELRGIETRIARLLERLPGINIRLDCGLAFLERNLEPGTARRAGLRGCVAGSRIVALGPDGSAYPCSQLVAPRFHAGNLLEDDPGSIWAESKNLRRIGNRRAKRAFRRTLCGVCHARDWCGGCLALSPDGLGADPGCPEPLLPPLDALGRDGRFADLGRHIQGIRSISVGEYMERYGVCQQRAISELRRFPGLYLDDSTTGRKRTNSGTRKVDRYELTEEDIVGEIQALIGRTSAGFPYAIREEVSGWLGVAPEDSLFPRWLLEPDPAPAPDLERVDSPERDRDHSRSGRGKRR